jgi:hypothetical protein
MLQTIPGLPLHVAGLHAFGEVSETDYEEALIPIMDGLLNGNKKINFVLILETNIKNFVSGAWCGNVKIGFKYFFDWGRVALVTDQKGVLGYSDLFKYIIPGKFKYFPLDNLADAIKWVSVK